MLITPHNLSSAKTERNRLIRTRYRQGATLTELASAFNISVQRIHQIVHL
jgi:hypothetical protein